MADERVDVCIIGSGFGGSIMAARLSEESGKNIVVLERGKRWSRSTFQQSQDPRYVFQLYEPIRGDGITVAVTKGVGGGSLIYSSLALRAPSSVFEQRDGEGRRIWPGWYIRQNLDPYYSIAESVLEVIQLGWERGGGVPSWQLVTKRDGVFAQGCDMLSRTCDPARLTLKNCRNCGWCSTGCKFDRKQSLILNYIPLAEKNGVEFRAECEVQVIRPAKQGYEADYRDLRSGAHGTIRSEVMIVAAGAIHSPALLLRSKRYMTRLSDQVGRNLSGNGDIALGGTVPGVEFEPYKGKIMGSVSYGWWDEGMVLKPAFALPFSPTVEYPVYLEGAIPPYYWGLEHKYMMKEYNNILFIAGLGLDGNDGIVSIDRRGRPKLYWRSSPKSQTLHNAQMRAVRQIIEAFGGTVVVTPCMSPDEVITVHPLATCRMAESISHGVVDENCQVFNYPNLYVVDGSSIPSAVGISPALTIAAIAEKVSGYVKGNAPEKAAWEEEETRQESSRDTTVYQNYPNPFNPDTWIPYQLGDDAHVVIKIYTSTGQLARTLNLGRKPAGLYTSGDKAAYWNGKNEAGEQVASGVYFYTIQAGEFTATKRMILAK